MVEPNLTSIEEYATLVPGLSTNDFKDLKSSIREHGQFVPVVVNQDLVILDGYHRYKACVELEIRPQITTRKFENQLLEKKFIIEINRNRRQLTPFQRIELEYKYEKIESELAKTRMSTAGKMGAERRWDKEVKPDVSGDIDICDGVVQKNNPPSGPKLKKKAELENSSKGKGKVIELAAHKAHVSPMTYYKGREIIRQNPPLEILDKLRKGEVKVDKVYKQLENQRKRQELLSNFSNSKFQLSDQIKLLEGDFVNRCKDLSPKSVALIYTDPPYDVESLPLYSDLAKVASILLMDGASLVTYCGQNLKYQVIQIMESNGLTAWWEIAIIQAGSAARIFNKNVVVTWKPLLWFVKGASLRTSEFIKDSVESEQPDKTLHPWTQSTVEAEHVISKLTIENDIVLDPMMGIATTGITSLNVNRQFIGIEKDAETFKIAKARLESIFSGVKKECQ